MSQPCTHCFRESAIPCDRARREKRGPPFRGSGADFHDRVRDLRRGLAAAGPNLEIRFELGASGLSSIRQFGRGGKSASSESCAAAEGLGFPQSSGLLEVLPNGQLSSLSGHVYRGISRARLHFEEQSTDDLVFEFLERRRFFFFDKTEKIHGISMSEKATKRCWRASGRSPFCGGRGSRLLSGLNRTHCAHVP